MGYRLNRLEKLISTAVPNTLLTEFGIYHRLESCVEWTPHQKSKLEVNYSFLLSKGLLRSYSTESSLNAIPAATPIYQQSNPLLLEKGQGELRVSSRSASSAERPFKCGTGKKSNPSDAVRIYQESEHKNYRETKTPLDQALFCALRHDLKA